MATLSGPVVPSIPVREAHETPAENAGAQPGESASPANVSPRRVLADGRILELWAMLLGNVRLTITLPELDGRCWDDAWCFNRDNTIRALIAFATWDGEGEPDGWNKHPTSGRWRKDGSPESEINQRDEPPHAEADR